MPVKAEGTMDIFQEIFSFVRLHRKINAVNINSVFSLGKVYGRFRALALFL